MTKLYKVIKNQSDLRDQIANSARERWYNTIVIDVHFVSPMTDWYSILLFFPHCGRKISTPNLSDLLNEHSLLINCSSFPSRLGEADLCIGFKNDWSRPTDSVIELTKHFFEKQGYVIDQNIPLPDDANPQLDFSYNALKIGINRGIFRKKNKEKNIQLHKDLESLYKILINYWEEI